ncbi:50S ribosomal protein L6 [Patescibacteria group bacterium]
MSKVGKKPISIPESVEVTVVDGVVKVKGPLMQTERILPEGVAASVEDGKLSLTLAEDAEKKAVSPIWGTYRALLSNDIAGSKEEFKIKLIIEGVGYGAKIQDKLIVLSVGLSHDVEMTIPEGITCEVKKNVITISGSDKGHIGQFAANVRKTRKPEPYKGKGIRYSDEHVRRKEGKKAVGEGEGE